MCDFFYSTYYCEDYIDWLLVVKRPVDEDYRKQGNKVYVIR